MGLLQPRGQRVRDRRERGHQPDPGLPSVGGPEPGQAHDGQVGIERGLVHARRKDDAHVRRIGLDDLEVGRVLLEIELLELDRRAARIVGAGPLERQPCGLHGRQRVLVGVGDRQVLHERHL
jgi:hypothetical protein